MEKEIMLMDTVLMDYFRYWKKNVFICFIPKIIYTFSQHLNKKITGKNYLAVNSQTTQQKLKLWKSAFFHQIDHLPHKNAM